ncbi:MAG: DsrE/DsrF/DrsH-like family protein [Candidatus Hodarchaeales archaeon]
MGKLAILVTSAHYEKLNTAVLIASGAVANDHEVLIFFMHDSVWALKKELVETNRKVHSIYPEVAVKVEEVDKEGKLHTWFNLIPDLKDLGELQIVACGLMMDIFELKKEELADFVDEIAGVAFFSDAAMEADKVISL